MASSSNSEKGKEKEEEEVVMEVEMPPPPPPKMITLTSSDGEVFKVEEEVAWVSKHIKNMTEDGIITEIKLPKDNPKITGEILAKVIEYCKKHAKY